MKYDIQFTTQFKKDLKLAKKQNKNLLNNEGVRYMEQLLIIEDDIGLNQGLCKALKADDRQIISCQDLKTAKRACFAAVYP